MIQITQERNHYLIILGKVKIRIYKGNYLYKIRRLIYDLYFYFKQIKLNKNKYVIIPLGTYCFSRAITTFNKLKKRHKNGEKTYPFDLAVFDFSSILNLIENNFSDFYDGLTYDSKNKDWINKKINARFPHDENLSREEFEKRYNKRINNFYNDIRSTEKKIYFLITSQQEIKNQQIVKLNELISTYRPINSYNIVLINQNSEQCNLNFQNLYIIDQSHNVNKYNYINKNGCWINELSARRTKEAQEIYNEITEELIKILKRTL